MRLSGLLNSVPDVFKSVWKKSKPNSSIPLYNKPTAQSAATSNNPTPQADPLHLLVCMKEGKFGTALHQEDINGLKSDRKLFEFLQDSYLARRGKLYSLLSLRAPERINLVKVRSKLFLIFPLSNVRWYRSSTDDAWRISFFQNFH
jgi:hypothetical protein